MLKKRGKKQFGKKFIKDKGGIDKEDWKRVREKGNL